MSSKRKNDNFAYLGSISKVANQSNQAVLIAIIGGTILLLIFIIMLVKHKPKQLPSAQEITMPLNNNVLTANVSRLQQMQSKNLLTTNNDFNTLINNQDNKQLLIRQNAPTQMYSAHYSPRSLTNANNNSKPSLLKDNSAYANFANSQNNNIETIDASHLLHPNYMIVQGELINAVLETAINSDLPGMVRAIITQPVYAYSGENVLIPAGSRLIGQYTTLAGNGAATARVFIIWNRIITPNNLSITINSPGVDELGRAGVNADNIDSHFWQIFGTAALLSVMSATTATYGVNASDQPNSANQYQQSIAEAFQQSSQDSLDQNLNIKPTINIYQGKLINVFVAEDLDFYTVLNNH
ncbi:MAG: hypothetical protein A3E87_06590 [Gammaproteobacteria bacterium RIFCSPHIGHO2_12_FULL_35_23]|nr:MAG: hypothetical protein A3E87_06590 [Gammaproteobacteria bacterium RIFCSPHIGHO2_12_FULL_35_23]